MKSLTVMAVTLSAVLSSIQPVDAQDVEALFEAARTGNHARVAELLDRGVDVNAATRYGVTALGFAADKGHFDVVRLLVDRGANVNVADSFYGSRPIDFSLRESRLDIAVYLLQHGSQGAVGVLNAAIRTRNEAAVRAALATDQADGAALASAATLAERSGNTAIDTMVKDAAARKPATARTAIQVDAALLRSYEGTYQSASSGAAVNVTFRDGALALVAEGQPTLTLRPFEERRFIADNAADVVVSFSGRGGIIERLAIARGTASLRYEREGFGDATSPAPVPREQSAKAVAPAATSTAAEVTRGKPLPWPAFRGANAAGNGDGQGAVAEWDVASGKNIRWKTSIPGLAISSPIVWGDRVIVVGGASDQDKTFRTGLYGDVKPVDDSSRHGWRVYAVDRQTGKILWEREASSGTPLTKRHTKSSQANATPVTDGQHIVAVFGAVGVIVCYDMNGTLLWKKDLGAIDSGWFLDPTYQWGHASSPIIYGSTVIVQADQSKGSFLAAFNLADGREIWRTPREELSTWSTPTVVRGAKGSELVTNGTKIRAYDPTTGQLLWTLAPNSEIVIGTPVVRDDIVYLTAGYPPIRPVYAVRAGGRGDLSPAAGAQTNSAVVWSHDRDGTYISTPIVYRDQLYTLNNNGILTAYDATTGTLIYRARVGGGGTAFSSSPVAADGRLYMASEDGDVYVAQAGREYKEIAKNVMGEVTMATPAISDGVIVIRTLHHLWGIGQ
jgi:outer membrane protein assembly factor BamB